MTNTTNIISQRIEKAAVSDMFGFQSTKTLHVFPKTNDIRVPKTIDGFVFDKGLVQDILYIVNKKRANIAGWLYGHRGTGKTSGICQVFNRLNYPLVTFAGTEESAVYQLIGCNKPIKGSFEWMDGPLTYAMRHGTGLLINEIDIIPPSVLAVLHDVLEGKPLELAENENEVIYPHPDFCMFGTGNTNGCGDESGLYSGTLPQNPALLERFEHTEVGYLPFELEEKVIENQVPKLDPSTRKLMLDYARVTRDLFTGSFCGNSDYPELATIDKNLRVSQLMSTRTLENWAERVVAFRNAENPLMETLHKTFLNKCTEAEKLAFKHMAELMFPSIR